MRICDFLMLGAALLSAPLAPLPAQAKPASATHESQELMIATDDGAISLSATLTLPLDCSRCPTAILLGVAGPNDRDLSFAGHRLFATLAEELADAGIATLRWDDRGVGESEGDWAQTSYEQLSADVHSALAQLRRHARVDGEALALIGLSEGALIAGMAASASRSPLAAVVLASPPGIPGMAALRSQFRRTLQLSGIVGEQAETYSSAFEHFLSLSQSASVSSTGLAELEGFLAGPGKALVPPYQFVPANPAAQAQLFAGPWYQSQLQAQPVEHYRQINAPLLIVSGERDLILPPEENIPPILQVQADAHWLRYSDVSHLLQPSRTGLPAEYASNPVTIDQRLMDDLVQWLVERLGAGES